MKFMRLSIAAWAVLGTSSVLMAGSETTMTFKPFATAKLYYETTATDAAGSDLFAQSADSGAAANLKDGGASGQALISAGATGKLNNCFGYGFEAMAVDTLGLENNLVSNVRMGSDKRANYNALDAQFWAPQAYVTYHPCDVGTNTTFKVGRQYLDTPLAFTERWNIAPNSFDAFVVMNQDIVNTTLIGAYVGKGNGEFVQVTNGNDFKEYVKEGAYAVGAITSLFDGAVPLSIWGYNVLNVADAIWADAGYKTKLGDIGLNLGAQYGAIMPDTDGNSLLGSAAEDSSGFGLKVGSSMTVAGMDVGLLAAYSRIDDTGTIALANTATIRNTKADGTLGYSPTVGGKKTKLYTAAIYGDGTHVALPGSEAFKLKASTKLAGIGSLAVVFVNNTNDTKPVLDMNEVNVVLGTTLPGGLGAKIIYMNRAYDHVNNNNVHNDANHIRLIIAKNF